MSFDYESDLVASRIYEEAMHVLRGIQPQADRMQRFVTLIPDILI
jgi:hypothetical protein